MNNPCIIPADGSEKAIVAGYVISIKDHGDHNILLFKEDTMDSGSKLVPVAAWGSAPGQSTGIDMQKITNDIKGRFVVCLCKVRKKEKDGKMYTNYDLQYIFKSPRNQKTA